MAAGFVLSHDLRCDVPKGTPHSRRSLRPCWTTILSTV